MTEKSVAPTRWGAWEELVLGGAVLRHGTAAWDVVAEELRSRTRLPSLFTPQECEAKYKNLEEQFSNCDAWFEELRKRRVAELRRELEISEVSIGFLQSKLDNLNAERERDSSFECTTSQTKSSLPSGNADDVYSSGKEAPRDGSSASCHSGDTGIDRLQECRVLASVSSQENIMKVDLRKIWGVELGWSLDSDGGLRFLKKKRALRKRRYWSVYKDESVDLRASHEDARVQHEDSGGDLLRKGSHLDLARILDSIVEHKDLSIFQHQLASQNGARYKKKIRRHVDLQTISSRIGDGSISSTRELFTDLFLLAKNAFDFYPKASAEYKSAIVLQNRLLRAVRGQYDDAGEAKLQGPRACGRNVPASVAVRAKAAGAPMVESGKKGGRSEAVAESGARKRGRPVKGGRGSGKGHEGSPNTGGKRARRR